jgi:hypothetical protein
MVMVFTRVRIAVVVLLACAVAASAAAAGGRKQEFNVGSTTAGKTVLPHRIHWLGFPRIPEPKVKEVDFLIDGKLCWVEHHAPYTYGYDDNYLVTSWLKPGRHTFTVRVIATDRSRGMTSTIARVLTAEAPPAKLAGSWKRSVKGRTWRVTVDKIGWRFSGPGGAGDLVDVGYLSPGLLEARGGIHTSPGNDREGNNWCNEPFQPVGYSWSVQGDDLTMTLTGPKRCDGQSEVWAGRWTRSR